MCPVVFLPSYQLGESKQNTRTKTGHYDGPLKQITVINISFSSNPDKLEKVKLDIMDILSRLNMNRDLFQVVCLFSVQVHTKNNLQPPSFDLQMNFWKVSKLVSPITDLIHWRQS